MFTKTANKTNRAPYVKQSRSHHRPECRTLATDLLVSVAMACSDPEVFLPLMPEIMIS